MNKSRLDGIELVKVSLEPNGRGGEGRNSLQNFGLVPPWKKFRTSLKKGETAS